ncbi:ParB/RepB/Spo0J family partition protein [Actinomyces bowdenii]|uniref:ParB/RepB/Spo0J family partition protein n=1 Tax=Actinomyces bowdenii TaxID=131109 RepID=UPI0027D46E11|nr:ParB N-terminal domain-containing protein [Actinomyces bowdenii]
MTLKQARCQASEGACRLVELAEDMEHLRVGEHVWVVPELLDGGPNVRSALPEDGLLVASVGEIGVQHEILAYPTLTGLVVLDGHRRLDAARRAGLEVVPVRVVDGTEGRDAAERTHRQLVLNDTAEHVSTSDRARALALFSASGMPKRRLRQIASDEEVAAAVGLKKAESNVEWLAAHLPTLSLVELAQVAQIAADPDCSASEEELVEALAREPGRIEHDLVRWRQDNERNRAVRLEAERLAAQGWRVLTREGLVEAMRQGGDNRIARVGVRVGSLASWLDGQALDPVEHESCPGHVLFVTWAFDENRVLVEAYCQAPRDNGHLPRESVEALALRSASRAAGAAPSPAGGAAARAPEAQDDAAAEVERAEEMEDQRLRAAALAAQEVRRRFITEQVLTPGRLSSTRGIKLVEWAMRVLRERPTGIQSAHLSSEMFFGQDLMARLVTSSGRSVVQPRLWVIALALAACEDRDLVGDYWKLARLQALRDQQRRLRDYLQELERCGYTLSEPEQLFLDRLADLEVPGAEGEAS